MHLEFKNQFFDDFRREKLMMFNYVGDSAYYISSAGGYQILLEKFGL